MIKKSWSNCDNISVLLLLLTLVDTNTDAVVHVEIGHGPHIFFFNDVFHLPGDVGLNTFCPWVLPLFCSINVVLMLVFC